MKKWKLCSIIAVFVLLLSSTIALLAGGGIFGFAKNDLEKEESVQEETNTSAATAPTYTNDWFEDPNNEITVYWSGSGTASNPWIISTVGELVGLAYSIYYNTRSEYLSSSYYYSGCYFKQTKHLDLSGYWWIPIGNYSLGRYFAGNYDGNGYIIRGVATQAGSSSEYNYQGLFGYVMGQSSTNKASLTNIVTSNSYIQGYSYVGGMAGYVGSNVTISDCQLNSGVVNATGSYVGGIVGSCNSAITKCGNTNIVTGNMYVGGVAGYLASSCEMSGCHNMSSVSAAGSYIGGVVGSLSGKIINSYNAGNVSGCGTARYVGGLIGEARSASIANGYNKGSISDGDRYVGGLVGFNTSSPIYNSFNSGDVSGSIYIGGVVGSNYSSTLTSCYYGGDCTLTAAVGTGSGSATRDTSLNTNAKLQTWYQNTSNWSSSYSWNFASIWEIDSANDGFPTFTWQQRLYLTFSPNHGSPNTDYRQTVVIGQAFTTLASNTYTRTGYTFAGWSIGNVVLVGEYQSASTTYYMPDYHLTLYAQWTADIFTLAFDLNNGVNVNLFNLNNCKDINDTTYSASIDDVAFSIKTTVSGNTLSNFKIQKWNGSSFIEQSSRNTAGLLTYTFQKESSTTHLTFRGNGTLQDPGFIYDVSYLENGTYTASAELTSFTSTTASFHHVKIEKSGSYTGYSPQEKNLEYNTPYGTLPTLTSTNEDFVFDGWYTEPNGGTQITAYTYVTEDYGIVYARWTVLTWNDYAATSYASGSGTASSPYIIKTPEQLAKVAVDSRSSTLSGKYYKMAADVDLSAHIWEGIGDTSQKFAGCFDGDLYQIKNIITTIDNYQVSNVIGLFSFVQSPSVIKNIIMKGGTVTAGASSSNCGIIAGATESAATITNCIVDGITVQGNDVNSSMGGIAGKFTSGKISNCIVMNCNIISKGTVGGICGWRGTLTDCAVINTTVASGWNISSREVSIGWSDNSTVNSSYAKVTIAGVEKKIMYGDSTAWANWTYNANLNNGYPVQTTLFHIGGFSGSSVVYNYLKNTLGFTVA